MPFWITSFNPRTILQVANSSCHLCKHYVELALFSTPLDGQRKEASASQTLSFKYTPPQFFFNFLKQIHTIGNCKGVVKSSSLLEFNFYWWCNKAWRVWSSCGYIHRKHETLSVVYAADSLRFSKYAIRLSTSMASSMGSPTRPPSSSSSSSSWKAAAVAPSTQLKLGLTGVPRL